MRRLPAFCLAAVQVLFAGCAGFGVVETSDPAAKLQDAEELMYRQDRPLIAERLIRQAVEIYRDNGDELGLANAYRVYGFFFRADSIEGRWSNYYRKTGFLESTATFESRHDKSLEYFARAADIFERRGRFDALTNVHFNAGITYVKMGELKAACRAFDSSLEDSRENLRRNPEAKPVLPSGYGSYSEFLEAIKKRYGCPYI
jgi:tetratricopeptide (TPR) repeat protein